MLKLAGVHLPSLKITLPKLRLRLKVGFAFWAFIILLFTPIFFLFYIFHNLPSPKTLVTRNLEVSTKIYDRNGVLLYNIFQDKNRTLVKLEEVPLVVRLATLASEDAEFYQHPGFSVKGVLRALYKIITKGELTGGSTITQQLVKNALLTPEKTVIRKIREVILAVITEMQFSKDEILEMYLNEVSYGGTSYGIAEASETYFAKDVKELTLAESAMLAGLPKSPTAYSPFGSDPNKAFVRQREVLSLMRINGFITKEQEEEAANQQITFASNKTDIKAPHFVMFVRSLLEEKYGKEIVAKGGLEVTTTLDYEIQKLAEKAVRDELSRLGSLHVQNGAVVVPTPTTGEILAMVGSKDYFDTAHDGNVNVVTSLGSPVLQLRWLITRTLFPMVNSSKHYLRLSNYLLG
jgi:membrane peptidoglycan carboxypeptidase